MSKVTPLRINGIHQVIFPGTVEVLETFLPGYGLLDIREDFEIYKLGTIILVGKGLALTGNVLCNTAHETVRGTDV